jgi:hypothetical protein
MSAIIGTIKKASIGMLARTIPMVLQRTLRRWRLGEMIID